MRVTDPIGAWFARVEPAPRACRLEPRCSAGFLYRADREQAMRQVAEAGYQLELSAVPPLLDLSDEGFAQWLNAIAFVLSDPVEIAISGDPAAADAATLAAVVRSTYRPFAVVAAGSSAATVVPLLQDRPQRDGAATAYVCRQFACRAPVTDPADLASQLASAS